MNYSNKAGMAVVCIGAVLLSPVSFAKQEIDKPGFYASVSANYWNNSRYQRIEKCIKFALYFTL